MNKLGQWFSECAGPLIAAQYALDLEAARAAWAEAEPSVADEPDAELRAVKHLRLRIAWFVALLELGPLAEAAEVFASLKPDLASPRMAEYAAVGAVCEYVARMHADIYGLEEIAPDELRALLARIPDEFHTANYWDALANWAFKHRDAELLDEAFAWFVMHRTPELAEWVFMRLMLMKRLLAGKATEEDVCGVLRNFDHPGQVADAERLLWPAIERNGLATDLTRALMEANRDMLLARPAPAG